MNKIIFGRKTIRFSIIRSPRRKKTIALSIEPDGKVLVRAPVNTTCSRLTHVVKSKAEWIITKLGSLSDVSQQLKKEFVSGESFYYLGRHMRLKILKDKDVKKTVVRMYRGRIEVIINTEGKNGKVPAEIRDAIIGWYKIQAARRIPERVEIYAGKMGLKAPGVFIREQKKIWGSCSTKGVLRFNWRISNSSAPPPPPNPLPPREGGLDSAFLFGKAVPLCSLPLDGGGLGGGVNYYQI